MKFPCGANPGPTLVSTLPLVQDLQASRKMRFSIKLLALALVCLSTLCQASGLEIVHRFYCPMPTGVTVSRTGRIFVNYPRWGDPVDFTVAEIQNGKAVAYPSADINLPEIPKQADRFISVQSVVVDPRDRLWVLDTGSIEFQKVSYGGPKLVGIDLKQNKIIKKIVFPTDVAVPETYLNDVRFDLTRGSEGFASITDSGEQSPNGMIVVDLGSGKSWRRLANHPSVKPDPSFIPVIDGQEIWYVAASGKKSRWASGSDGIAIDQARKLLYYCPLSSRRLYSVSLDALSDISVSEADVEKTVSDLGDKGGASDGLETDLAGRGGAGSFACPGRDREAERANARPASDTCNQLFRQKQFHGGKDLRQQPYYLFRIHIDATRIEQ